MRPPTLACGDLRLDPRAPRASVDGEPLRLTSLEYRLLHYLMMHQGRVISRTELVEHLYDQDFDRDFNTIEVFIGRLRKKIGPDRSRPCAASATAWWPSEGEADRPIVKPGGLGRPSLARRLVLLAAGWSLAVLVVAGFAMTLCIPAGGPDALRPRPLANCARACSPRPPWRRTASLVAPELIDQRAARVALGQVLADRRAAAGGQVEPLVRSRSLDEYLLTPPPSG